MMALELYEKAEQENFAAFMENNKDAKFTLEVWVQKED